MLKKVYLLQFVRNGLIVGWSEKVYTSKGFAQKLANEYNRVYTDLTCQVDELDVDDFQLASLDNEEEM